MTEKSKVDNVLLLTVVALLAWAIPGAGHFAIKENKRGIIIFITITITFLAGIYVGSIGIIGTSPWYAAQLITSPVVAYLANIASAGGYESYGKPSDIGLIYTTIAGMLNLLCIISAVYMAYSGRGKLIGEEEYDQ